MGVLAAVKERVLEKLAVAAVPAEALENARRLLESVVRDATVTAHSLSKDALHRIKTHLLDILPPSSSSPALATKMVDEAEKEATAEVDNKQEEEDQSDKEYHPKLESSTAPIISLNKLSSRL